MSKKEEHFSIIKGIKSRGRNRRDLNPLLQHRSDVVSVRTFTRHSLVVINTTKGKLPSLPFCDMKNAVLGKAYVLSLVVVGDALSKKLNNTYRSKNKPTDILSFPLGPKQGEIFLNLKQAKKEAANFDRKLDNFIAFLFIHGLMHLKGFTHSSRMESEEKKIRQKFNV